MKTIKIVFATILSFVISLILAYFGYLFFLNFLPDCGLGCGFGMAFASLFYIPVLACVIAIPVYIFMRRLFRI